jgi:RsiW-degrading membrane proteinase PrsW (M82 family)
MAAILAFALALRQRPKWRAFAIFSFFSLAAIFLSGLWAAATAVQLSPIMGLAERVTIGIFILWLLAFSLRLIGPTAAELEATAERASG